MCAAATLQDMPYGSFYDLKKSGQKAKAKTHAEFWVAVRCVLHANMLQMLLEAQPASEFTTPTVCSPDRINGCAMA